MTPLLSIVIPTYGRQKLLQRAVGSALQSAPDGQVEVIVVPNGADRAWMKTLGIFSTDTRVKVFPIQTQHASVARNHGISLAVGKYIRLLDDDDFLLDGALDQYYLIDQAGADICSGFLLMSDGDDQVYRTWKPSNETQDFVVATCSRRRICQVTAHLFKREFIHKIPWDTSLPFSQDICWFLDIAATDEIKWIKIDKPVGIWNRHTGNRISIRSSENGRRKIVAERLWRVADKLRDTNRLTVARRAALADGIWEQIHSGLGFSPVYWWKMIFRVRKFCPKSKPSLRIYHFLPFHPFIVETITAPLIISRHALKKFLLKSGLTKRW